MLAKHRCQRTTVNKTCGFPFLAELESLEFAIVEYVVTSVHTLYQKPTSFYAYRYNNSV